MDAKEALALKAIAPTRSGELENTTFALLAPDGKTALVRASRSPMMTYGSRERMVESLQGIAARYARKASQAAATALPAYKDLRLALDVASCDSRPLVVVYAKDAQRRARLEKTLAKLAWSEPFIGRYHYIVVDDAEQLKPIEGFALKSAVAVVEPGPFGLTGKVLENTSEQTSSRLKKLLAAGLEAFVPVTKDPHAHVRSGRRTGQEWDTEIPITGPRARKRNR